MAEKSGFKYFAKVAWKKGNFISNTGRKSKNTEDVMIFSNGEPRKLKLDAKKNLATAQKNNLEVKGKSSYEVRDILQEKGLLTQNRPAARSYTSDNCVHAHGTPGLQDGLR